MGVVVNAELEAALNQRVTNLNTDSVLRLFKNDIVPDPATVEGDFVEADYDGYAEVDLTGEWSSAVQAQDGEYESETDSYLFNPPTMGSPNTIYGFFIVDSVGLVACERFSTPIIMEVGGLNFRLRCVYKFLAASIL